MISAAFPYRCRIGRKRGITMKLRVQYADGKMKTITLQRPVEQVLGNAMNHFSCGDGMEYFFDQDGYYDRWSRTLAGIFRERGAANPRTKKVHARLNHEQPGGKAGHQTRCAGRARFHPVEPIFQTTICQRYPRRRRVVFRYGRIPGRERSDA